MMENELKKQAIKYMELLCGVYEIVFREMKKVFKEMSR